MAAMIIKGFEAWFLNTRVFRCPNMILKDQPSEELAFWRCPIIPNHRLHEGDGRRLKLYQIG
jgi:hypothetical protein